ncbi:MAG: hypothetical protein JO232_09680, partial [Verrucomicrobia bacterium]|nr:hypothetical protein [Verrucomicrobiota bacterium]
MSAPESGEPRVDSTANRSNIAIFVHSFDWFDRLKSLLARELAPTSDKLWRAFRLAIIGAIGGGLVAACHVDNELGLYQTWALVGAGPMMSPRSAGSLLIAQAFVLASSVVAARALAETPWLTIPFLFALVSLSTYWGTIYKVGAPLVLSQVPSLIIFYLLVFTPQRIGWFASGAFGGFVIAFGVLALFDNWLWPDRAEATLADSLGASLARTSSRFRQASNYYLNEDVAGRPPVPPPTSDLPTHMTLLDRAMAEGVPEFRHAALLSAITRVARINLEVDRLTVAARETVSRQIRSLLLPELGAAVKAITVALDELARELPTHIAMGALMPAAASE